VDLPSPLESARRRGDRAPGTGPTPRSTASTTQSSTHGMDRPTLARPNTRNNRITHLQFTVLMPPSRAASTMIYVTMVLFPMVYYLEKPSSLTRTQTSLTLFPPARPHSPPLLAPSPCSCNEEAA